MSPTQMTPERRFWSKVEKTDGCWLWLGARNESSGGYGMTVDPDTKAIIGSHRYSWSLSYGPIPPGKHVLHRCDTPLCVRPDHLFLGTHRDNMRDKASKGRGGGHKRLTAEQVIGIRKLYAHDPSRGAYSRISRAYKVNRSTVKQIVERRTWSYIGPDEGHTHGQA